MRVVFLATLVAFVANALRALSWAYSGVFDTYNVLFDADPNTYWEAFAHGWVRPGLVHAATPFVAAVARGTSATLVQFGWEGDPVAIRKEVALLIAPMAGALSVALLYLIARTLELSRAGAALVALSLSSLFAARIFFAMPESYPLSAPLLLCAFWLAAREARNGCDTSGSLWFAIAAACAAVTLTNGAVVCAVFMASRWARGESPWATLGWTLLLGISSVIVVVAILLLGNVVLGFGAMPVADHVVEAEDWAMRYVTHESLLTRLMQISAIPVDLFGLSDLNQIPNPLGIRGGAKYQTMVTLAARSSFVLLLYATAGALLWFILLRAGLRDPVARPLSAAVLAALLLNTAIHSIFGVELFLYALHFWVLLVVAAIAFVPTLPRKVRPMTIIGTALLAALGQYRIGLVDRFLGI